MSCAIHVSWPYWSVTLVQGGEGLARAKTFWLLLITSRLKRQREGHRCRLIDIEEENHSGIKDAITGSDDNDDASIFSIANGYSSEDDDVLPDENNVKSTVLTKRT